jgi:hypothetical protein
MADDDKAIYITRLEFHSALALLWTYIFLALSAVSRAEERWSLTVLQVAALAMAIVHAVLTIISRRSKITKDKPTPPVSGSMN